MIDDATDMPWHFIKSFTLWFNENVWGDCEAGCLDDECCGKEDKDGTSNV